MEQQKFNEVKDYLEMFDKLDDSYDKALLTSIPSKFEEEKMCLLLDIHEYLSTIRRQYRKKFGDILKAQNAEEVGQKRFDRFAKFTAFTAENVDFFVKYHIGNIVDSKFFKEYLKIKELSKDLSKSESTAIAQQIVDKFEDEMQGWFDFYEKSQNLSGKIFEYAHKFKTVYPLKSDKETYKINYRQLLKSNLGISVQSKFLANDAKCL